MICGWVHSWRWWWWSTYRLRRQICHRCWLGGTTLTPSLTAVLIRSIQALRYTFLLYYILPIKTAIRTLLTTMNMQSLLHKVIALLACSTAISISQFCALDSHYLMCYTFMTFMAGGWVICIREFSRSTWFASNLLCWGYVASTYWKQS